MSNLIRLSLRDVREQIDMLYGPPIIAISDCMRGFMIAGPGKKFVSCDLSAIEARKIAWLAGEEATLKIFRGHGKIYEHSASNIFRIPMDRIDSDQRQIGKVSVLSLGYQGGVGALQTMARGYGVTLAPAYSGLWASAPPEHREKAIRAYKANYKKPAYKKVSREEYIASDLTKQAWREANPNIVKYWYALEEAAMGAVQNPGLQFSAGAAGRQVSYLKKGSFLLCKLPSSRVLFYPYPKVIQAKTPWDELKEVVSYMSLDTRNQWVRFKAYGGLWAENITQASSRDLLAQAMLRLDKAGYPIALHVHDEAVCEVDAKLECKDSIHKIFCEVPTWAKDLPIAAGTWEGPVYKK